VIQYLLFFHMALTNALDLQVGRLELIDLTNNRVVDRYIATSGCPGFQGFEDQSYRGKGPIPRTDLAQIATYKVGTVPIDLSATKGIAGNFYIISPALVKLKSGETRGDFGIHFDANVPGSAGCIVIENQDAFKSFEQTMRGVADGGVKEIPLLVGYSECK
jgi:hypothetical protein